MRVTTASDFQPVIHRPAATVNFLNEQEYRYFGMFRESMAPLLSSYFNSGLWDRLILQACESNPSIRQAIIAIAALNRTEELARLPSSNGAMRELSSARANYKCALRQYGQAIQSMQHHVYGKDDLRISLLSCIVITCFETLQGNYYLALRQIVIGHGLLKGRFEGSSSTGPNQLGVEEELAQAFGFLAKHTRDSRSPKRYDTLKSFGQARMSLMPHELQTLDDAKMYLKLLTQRLTHFITSMAPSTALGTMKFDDSESIPEKYVAERESLLAELRNWNDAFAPLLRSARAAESTQEQRLDTMVLQLTYLKYYFVAAAVPNANQDSLDPTRFVPLFAQIVSLAREILQRLNDTSPTSTFDFEMQVICPLYTVVQNCPNPILRKEALELAQPWKQSAEFVDSFSSGQLTDWIRLMVIATWVRSKDEENLKVDEAPELLRIGGVDLLNFG
jgi:hypothetical protein